VSGGIITYHKTGRGLGKVTRHSDVSGMLHWWGKRFCGKAGVSVSRRLFVLGGGDNHKIKEEKQNGATEIEIDPRLQGGSCRADGTIGN